MTELNNNLSTKDDSGPKIGFGTPPVLDTSVKSEVTEPEPNIIFVGEGLPITKINNGMDTIKLPAVGVQSNTETKNSVEVTVSVPFYHKDAGTIIQLFPGEYKRFVKKG